MLKNKTQKIWIAIGAAAVAGSASILIHQSSVAGASGANVAAKVGAAPTSVLTLTDRQLAAVKVRPVSSRDFAARLDAVGYVDYDEDRTVPAFAPWAGRIRQVFVKAGDDVRQGAALYSIDSPDLVQAESTLIASAGVLQLTSKALDRERQMHEIDAAAQKDVEQAQSDHQSAEAAYQAARDAVRIFGKTDAEIAKIVAARRTDGELRITSPISGRITARSAAPGLFVQPGNAPAPVTVADLSTMWLVANVTEYDLPRLRIGQELTATMAAYPGRTFTARVTNIASALDPATHRVAVRAEVRDPNHELLPQMLATFAVKTAASARSIAVPLNGVVRESDGTMVVFITQDGRQFERRPVRVGVEQDGWWQILSGLDAGERVAADGALFLSNALSLAAH
ncbi:MAG: efflux RND transporter periplasmic adaptor subunit [Paucibacter sp.]|nr:efflux RND transporter periplasmic adaptor subunit [Roseateles sp.]